MPAPSNSCIAVWTAMPLESRYIARSLGISADRKCFGHDVVIRCIGIGARYATAAQLDGAAVVVLAGFAGGLCPTLMVGDVVIDLPPEFPALPKTFAARTGRIKHSPTPVLTVAAKAELFASTGALAVEMESAVVGPIAAAAGVPVLAVRAITDAAGDALDPVLLRCVDDMGRPRRAVLAKELLRHPGLATRLVRLAGAARTAGRRLGQTVGDLLRLPEFERFLALHEPAQPTESARADSISNEQRQQH